MRGQFGKDNPNIPIFLGSWINKEVPKWLTVISICTTINLDTSL